MKYITTYKLFMKKIIKYLIDSENFTTDEIINTYKMSSSNKMSSNNNNIKYSDISLAISTRNTV